MFFSIIFQEFGVAKCRNRRFTGKSIRNDVMLFHNIQEKVDQEAKLITTLLDERESIWTNQQKVILKEEIKKKLKKTIDFNDFVKNLLNGCKKWGGPVTSASELLEILRKKKQIQQRRYLKLNLLSSFILT